jgi:hypothetical protein
MSLGQKHYVTCPHCGCELRAERLTKHCAKVHDKATSTSTIVEAVSRMKCSPTRKPRIPRKSIKIRSAEAELQAYANKLKSAPRKCASEGCRYLVRPPEAFCDICKQRKIRPARPKVKRRLGICNCGAPVVPGESLCYDCLGD